ncbi:carotenoid biosynthesis protein [Hymenobacter busanensis]|uniref:Carotenoid biosynthesis protein n=1 Tax=Hymenobacter busanensis TaxID=2607656 RepID=A0A7L4ZZ52_9BACT|nr:carotenoid biosynthesis protein [Hymenobacter busanensis]KAA9333102.1 carotenoid biosynthesis protein [Hymenobacter busanensis]QHJ08223.1 carotenoid biosynthesis protein [Hymenobacter busanensis]
MPYSDPATSAAPAPPAAHPPQRRLRVAQGILLLFHVTGFVGLAFSKDPSFYLQFVPLNLLLTAALLLAHDRHSPAPMFGWFCLTVMLVGFGIEVAGVRTGIIFGQYDYGNTLGIRVLGVPLIIGLNWLLLTYLAGGLAQRLPLPGLLRALLAAVLMVGLDVCIEPVAVHFGWWQWRFGVIPLQNFKAWFAVSFILQIYLNSTHVQPGRNPLVPFVYLLQLLFFFGLGYFIR